MNCALKKIRKIGKQEKIGCESAVEGHECCDGKEQSVDATRVNHVTPPYDHQLDLPGSTVFILLLRVATGIACRDWQ